MNDLAGARRAAREQGDFSLLRARVPYAAFLDVQVRLEDGAPRFRLPFRPLLRFVYMYFLRMGFLDGRPGLVYCRLLAMYEYWTSLKMRELKGT